MNADKSTTVLQKIFSEKFQILDKIGSGAASVVYKAICKNTQKTVALKIMHIHLLHDEENISRFLAESELLQKLDHPCIVKNIETGNVEEYYYQVQEFIENDSLFKKIRTKGIFEFNEIYKIFKLLCDGLQKVHQNKIIHRDINSNNIIMRNETPVLIDFGIAKSEDNEKAITRIGTIMGTPEYMSPEQANGNKIDARTDLYSMGVLLYEMSTGGHLPFKGSTPLSVIQKVIEEFPTSPRYYNNKISPSFENIIFKSLAKDPSLRFQNVQELMDALILVKRGRTFYFSQTEKNIKIIKKTKAVILGCIIIIVIFLVINKFDSGTDSNGVPKQTPEEYADDYIKDTKIPLISKLNEIYGKDLSEVKILLENNSVKIIELKKIQAGPSSVNKIINFHFHKSSNQIKLEVSKKGYILPDFTKMDINSTTSELKILGLESIISRISSTNISKNKVINTIPNPGQYVYEGDKIKLIVGK